ncbi:MAG: UDP-N-acetylglucosamine 2-epimerase (hydrolyzing) [Methanomicrobiales archaeon HGW-Methanomicrobiales-2]|jgi:UDP-hydrolysing UDP-N-acetyl-D-glucosamine 2-epimerase|nr:MAG: UDP-N-acetylglucosamine 2-epimerase (hydrolyzing) [Methanomicrobiales archaeon HGW-Methanomicrobiales-5]PKL62031.1 MAG: UDP-N-acetylglucosamine 2-epimerase (hydrolyzing) [Methanomicrobiales archaeon HGW-Methanomicrobiales-2]
MKRKIAYITGTRADYGLMRSVLHQIHDSRSLSLDIIVTGMHLMDEFGMTIEEIQNDGFNCHIIDVQHVNDAKESVALFIGEFIQRLTPLIRIINPDIILILGDRGEMLAGAIVGAYLSVPVAHIHGGEVTSTVDDLARHAITKLSHIHFPATEKSAERIIRMGEDPSRVFVVGAPGLDQILHEPLLEPEDLEKRYCLNFSDRVLLVVQHPVTLEVNQASEQMRETLEAVSLLQYQTVVVYPNADAGGRAMIEVIKEYEHLPYIRTYKNIPHKDYLSLMRYSSVLIGNSSSGIIEAPSFGIPTINIGSRQKGRQRGDNVVDVDYNREAIASTINYVLNDENYINKINLKKNPYGDGNAGKRITTILSGISVNSQLLQKE